MNAKPKVLLTQSGTEKLQRRIRSIEKRRDSLLERIQEARASMKAIDEEDLTELTLRRSRLEEQLIELKEVLKNAQIVKPTKRDKVNVGSQVKLDNSHFSLNIQLVDSIEADPRAGSISVDSPLGAAIYGKRVGEEVVIEMPGRKTVYEVAEIG